MDEYNRVYKICCGRRQHAFYVIFNQER